MERNRVTMAIPYHFLLSFLIALLSAFPESQSRKRPNKLQIFPKLVMRTDFIHDCPNVSSLAFFTSNTHIKTFDDGFTFDVDLRITRVIPTITQAIFYLYNCEDRASGKCPLFQTWRYGKEYCRLIEMKNQIFSPIFQNIRPRMKCPLQPGVYLLRNGTVDVRGLQALPFPLEQYYWRLRWESYDPTFYHCIESAAQFLRSRS